MRIYCVDEKKLRFGLQIFDDMDPESTKRFWIKTLRVRARQFGKIIITPSRGKGTYREKTKHGVLTIYFSNTKLRALLGHQIEELGYVS